MTFNVWTNGYMCHDVDKDHPTQFKVGGEIDVLPGS